MTSKALRDICGLGVWTLRDAAWIFVGYSPLQLQKDGHLYRLAGDEPVAIGSLEYRKAEEDQKLMEETLIDKVGNSLGTEFVLSKSKAGTDLLVSVDEKPDNHLDRNWLIDQIVNFTDVDVWWVDKLIGDHWLPAYINSDALSPRMLEERGMQSFVYPEDQHTIINAKVDIKSVTEVTADGSVIHSVEAKFFSKGVKPRTKFYRWLYAVIEMKFMDEGLPLPTARELYDHLQDTSESHKNSWKIWREDDGKIHWAEVNPPEGQNKDPAREATSMALGTLSTRLDDWFSKK